MKRALEEPMRQIAHNAGHEGAVVVGRIRESKDDNFGFNADTGEYGDLVKAGVIDPAKVTRLALQNAASIAGLMLTTEALVADIKEDDKKGAAARRRYARAAAAWAACTKPARPWERGLRSKSLGSEDPSNIERQKGAPIHRGALFVFRSWITPLSGLTSCYADLMLCGLATSRAAPYRRSRQRIELRSSCAASS